MHTFRSDITRFKQDFRDRMLEVLHRSNLTQKEIADECGVHQSTVHRWFSYGGDIDFPAALTAALSKSPMRELGLAVLEFQAAGLGMETRPLHADGRLNGSIVDDTLSITEYIGKLAQLVNSGELDYVEARKRFEQIRDAANVGLLELERMRLHTAD